MKKIIKHYLVKVIKATNMGNEIWEKILSNFDEAKAYYNKELENLIQTTIEDNGLNAKEAEEYRDNLGEDYYSDMDWLESTHDPDLEWTIGITEFPEEIEILKETIYILTHCRDGYNCNPQIFYNKEVAINALKSEYDECLMEGDYVSQDELFDTKANIEYIDGTYDRFQIFEVEEEK